MVNGVWYKPVEQFILPKVSFEQSLTHVCYIRIYCLYLHIVLIIIIVIYFKNQPLVVPVPSPDKW